MSLSFQKAILKSSPTENIEFCNLKTGNKFVQVKVEKKTVRVKDDKSRIVGRYINQTLEKELLGVSYPQMDVNVIWIPAQERNQYFLVVNHTLKRANPVLKSKFDEFYTRTSGKAKGDAGLIAGRQGTNPEENKRQKGKNKEMEKRK